MARLKKSTSILAILSLIFVGTLIIFNQVFAAAIMCDDAAEWCEFLCEGDFQLGGCWESNGLIYCTYECQCWFPPPGFPPCPWSCPHDSDVCIW